MPSTTSSHVNESRSDADYQEILIGTIHNVGHKIDDVHSQKANGAFIKLHGLLHVAIVLGPRASVRWSTLRGLKLVGHHEFDGRAVQLLILPSWVRTIEL